MPAPKNVVDLIVQGPTKEILLDFAILHDLMTKIIDDQNETVFMPCFGFDYCQWGGDGLFKTKIGDEKSPPIFADGFVFLFRIHNSLLQENQIIPENAVLNTTGIIPYYQVGKVKIYRPNDVDNFVMVNGLPNHRWAGGNKF